MTREEFNKILSEETNKEIVKIQESFSNVDGMNHGELLAQIMASSITASENIVLFALERAGILKYDD